MELPDIAVIPLQASARERAGFAWATSSSALTVLEMLKKPPVGYVVQPHVPWSLRLFALWCAQDAGCNLIALNDTRAFLRGDIDAAELATARQDAGSGASGALVCGARRCVPSAARSLAAFQTTAPSAWDAAESTSRWALNVFVWEEAAKWLETCGYREVRELVASQSFRQIGALVERRVGSKQAAMLRRMLGSPFMGLEPRITRWEIAGLLRDAVAPADKGGRA